MENNCFESCSNIIGIKPLIAAIRQFLRLIWVHRRSSALGPQRAYTLRADLSAAVTRGVQAWL
jgi:hypothetical protein